MGREYTGSESAAAALERRLRQRPPLLLDGATGTELERRGVRSALPLWSALGLLEAPGVVRAIHADYVAAGADALTANTFRTQRRALARGGHGARAAELTRLAVELAHEAAAGAPRRVFVLGSAPTLEDCYRPDLVPDAAALAREHAEHARNLVAAGVDAILVETHNTVREAVAAVRAARDAGAPAWASFVCGEGARLLSGEALGAALDAVAALGPVAVGVNCLPPSAVPACLPVLRAAGLPFSAYANLGEPDDATGFRRREDCAPDEFAGLALAWADAGASAVGGCCGTTPAHVRALRRALDARC
jgi:S-methylmethionine-dependent homocysteine/selenocysteine methylase